MIALTRITSEPESDTFPIFKAAVITYIQENSEIIRVSVRNLKTM